MRFYSGYGNVAVVIDCEGRNCAPVNRNLFSFNIFKVFLRKYCEVATETVVNLFRSEYLAEVGGKLYPK